MPKKRLDVVLVERGLAESRAQAQALIMAGRVPGHAKAGEVVEEAAPLEGEGPPPYAARGAMRGQATAPGRRPHSRACPPRRTSRARVTSSRTRSTRSGSTWRGS